MRRRRAISPGSPGADTRSRSTPKVGWVRMALGLAFALTGCSLDGLLKDELPPTVTDPAITETPEGALAAYHGAVAQFRTAFGTKGNGSVVTTAGLLSDELRYANFTGGSIIWQGEDQRVLPEIDKAYSSSAATYSLLQKARGQAGQALGLLTRYRPEEPALAGRVHALAGYAEILLAELFCSGIPLSTLDYGGDYTYHAGSSTEEVLAHARAHFDSALALGGDSANVVTLARVGLARALLASGRTADAAAAVASVPDNYRDTLTYPATVPNEAFAGNAPNFAYVEGTNWAYSVSNREGGNGLDYATSDDPRTRVSSLGTIPGIGTQWHPDKYATDGGSSLVLASGLEARLIEAEALLRANSNDGAWLAKLNALRTDGTQDGNGVYNPGGGGYAGLAPLADPGSDSARVSLVFRERAFWLFLTGHRQGDLRRLLRQYPQYWPSQDRVYPAGQYTGNNVISQYGSDVAAPIPPDERVLNPRFTGCFSRDP